MAKKKEDIEEIRGLLQKISEAWLKGDPDDLMEYFPLNTQKGRRPEHLIYPII